MTIGTPYEVGGETFPLAASPHCDVTGSLDHTAISKNGTVLRVDDTLAMKKAKESDSQMM